MESPVPELPDDPGLVVTPDGWKVQITGPCWQERDAHVLDAISTTAAVAIAVGLISMVLPFKLAGVALLVLGIAVATTTGLVRGQRWDHTRHTVHYDGHRLVIDGPRPRRFDAARLVDAQLVQRQLMLQLRAPHRKVFIAAEHTRHDVLAWVAATLSASAGGAHDLEEEQRAAEALLDETKKLRERTKGTE